MRSLAETGSRDFSACRQREAVLALTSRATEISLSVNRKAFLRDSSASKGSPFSICPDHHREDHLELPKTFRPPRTSAICLYSDLSMGFPFIVPLSIL